MEFSSALDPSYKPSLLRLAESDIDVPFGSEEFRQICQKNGCLLHIDPTEPRLSTAFLTMFLYSDSDSIQ